MLTIPAQSRDHLRQTVIDEIKSLEESTRALKSRRNQLIPISRLPPETLATIFTFLSASAWSEKPAHVEWINVAHVCGRWRDITFDHPRFWSYVNFSKLSSAGVGEILARAKMAPLHLEAEFTSGTWMPLRSQIFERQLAAHISHTRHLVINESVESALQRLPSSAPLLEFLSLSQRYVALDDATIPDYLLNCTAPSLTSLELEKCDISWKSPLLKGLRNLQILGISTKVRPKLEDWLDALNEMPKLEELFIQSATPIALLANPLLSERSRTITLPSLTHFRIHALAKDCALALAHLLLPALIWLHVDVNSNDVEGEDARLVIPYVAQNAYVLQDVEPIRSILIAGERTCAEVCAWATPNAEVEISDQFTMDDMPPSACLTFAARGTTWRKGVDTAILEAILTHLPVNSVLTLTIQKRTRLSKEFWLRHASILPLLEEARLVPTSVGAFLEMLVEDAPLDGPRLPSLTRLSLLYVRLTSLRAYHIEEVLIERVEQGVPLEDLDLRTCVTADYAIQFLSEIVVDVQEPLNGPPMETEEFFEDSDFLSDVGIGYHDEVEYDDGESSYGDTDDSENEYEDEDESEDEGAELYDEEFMYQLFDEGVW